jgi:hypothetical protein
MLVLIILLAKRNTLKSIDLCKIKKGLSNA